MGNCFRRESTMQWAGDDWGDKEKEDPLSSSSRSPIQKKGSSDVVIKTEAKIADLSSLPATAVKIKITKKQLEDLLGKVDLKEISVEQVLIQLMKVGGGENRNESHHRPWRPALQSIPEVN